MDRPRPNPLRVIRPPLGSLLEIGGSPLIPFVADLAISVGQKAWRRSGGLFATPGWWVEIMKNRIGRLQSANGVR